MSVKLLLRFRARKSPGAFADHAECPMGTSEIPAFGGVVRTVISGSEIIGKKSPKSLRKGSQEKGIERRYNPSTRQNKTCCLLGAVERLLQVRGQLC